MKPSAFRLDPYTHCFHYAILSATRYVMPGTWRVDLWHRESAPTTAQPKQEDDGTFVFLPVAISSYSQLPVSISSSFLQLPFPVTEMADRGTTLETAVVDRLWEKRESNPAVFVTAPSTIISLGNIVCVLLIPRTCHQYFVWLLPEGKMGEGGVGEVKCMIGCGLVSAMHSVYFCNYSYFCLICFSFFFWMTDFSVKCWWPKSHITLQGWWISSFLELTLTTERLKLLMHVGFRPMQHITKQISAPYLYMYVCKN